MGRGTSTAPLWGSAGGLGGLSTATHSDTWDVIALKSCGEALKVHLNSTVTRSPSQVYTHLEGEVVILGLCGRPSRPGGASAGRQCPGPRPARQRCGDGGVGLGFVGGSGMGKSTLAALLCAGGGRFITDDLLRLQPDGRAWRCFPGSGGIRLRPGAAALAGAFPATVARDITGWTHGAEGMDRSMPPLGAIVMPRPSRRCQALQLERLSPSRALLALMAWPRVPGLQQRKLLQQRLDASPASPPASPPSRRGFPGGLPLTASWPLRWHGAWHRKDFKRRDDDSASLSEPLCRP